MEVAGIVINFSDVDKYLVGIESADNAQNIAQSLIDFLQKCQKKIARKGEAEELSQELNYTVRKIVEKLSQLGPNPQLIYTLNKVITYFSVLSVSWLLGLVDSLEAKAKEREEEEANDSSTFPILLILVAAINQIDPKLTKQVESIGRRLTQVAMTVAGLAELAYDGLFQLMDRLSSHPSLVPLHFLPSVSPLLEAQWSANTLLLLLRVTDLFKTLDVTPFAKKLKNKVITHPNNLEVVAAVLGHENPKLESPFWTLLLKSIKQLSPADMKAFVTGIWKVISGTLGSKKKDAKLISLFTMFWDLGSNVYLSLLIDSLFLVLRRQQTEDNEELTAATLKIKEAAVKDPSHIGAAVLCYYPELAEDLSPEVVASIVNQLASHFYDQSLNPVRIGQALAHIARDSHDNELVLAVLKFLFFHGFFVPNSNPSAKKTKGKLPVVLGTPLAALGTPVGGGEGEKGLGGAVRKEVQNQFFRLLVHRSASLLARKTDKKDGSKDENEEKKKAKKEAQARPMVSSLFAAMVQFRAQLSSLSDQVELRKPLEEAAEHPVSVAEVTVGAILKQFNIKENRKELDAFLLLLCISYIIQLYDPQEPIDTISDLLQCYEDIFTPPKTKQKKSSTDKKDKAVAVLVDVVISLQAKPIFLVGTLPEYIIKCFAKQLTVEAVDGILKAMTEFSLNKTEDEDDSEDDEVNMLDDEDEDESGDEDEDENEDEDDDEEMEEAAGNGKTAAADDSDSDIMLDDLDEDALKELDNVIAKIMKQERKPKMKQPHSSKEPDIDFRERVASLLHAYTKKSQTTAVLELMPALLEAIHKLQEEKANDTKEVDKTADAETRRQESHKRQQKTKFYISVTSLISTIIKDICHTRGILVQKMPETQREKLLVTLTEYAYSKKGKEISELACEGMLLLTSNATQLMSLITDASKRATKPTVQYLVRRICMRFSSVVLQDSKLLSLLIERYAQHIQSFVDTLDTKSLTSVGQSLADLFMKQVKSGTDTRLLPMLRHIIQKLVTLIGKEAVQKAFPTLVFSLNSVITPTGGFAYTPAQSKLARHIAALAFVGSQKKDKKTKKLLAKKMAKEKDEPKDNEEEEAVEEEEEEDPKASKWKKGDLYYTKNKAYQKSRKRKSVSDQHLENDGNNKRFVKKKRDTKWFNK